MEKKRGETVVCGGGGAGSGCAVLLTASTRWDQRLRLMAETLAVHWMFPPYLSFSKRCFVCLPLNKAPVPGKRSRLYLLPHIIISR